MLLKELASFRVVDREQAKRIAGFGTTTQVNARLLRLTRAGLLRRSFIGTTNGGQKALYMLSLNGAKLVDVPFRSLRRRRDEVLTANFFVTHQLSVNEIHCDLKFRPIPITEAKVERWLDFFEPLEAGIRLIPDGYVEIRFGQKMVAAFLEVDLGTEGVSVWKRKIENYVRYAISGAFEKRFGQPQFRVLVVASTDRRMRSLKATTQSITEKIFWFTTVDSIRRDGFWSTVWLRTKDGERHSLL